MQNFFENEYFRNETNEFQYEEQNYDYFHMQKFDRFYLNNFKVKCTNLACDTFQKSDDHSGLNSSANVHKF